MADFEKDIALLEEYNQWKATHAVKDVSPSAFVVHKAQQEAFAKLEEIEKWAEFWNLKELDGDTNLYNEFLSILEGRV